MPVDRIRNSEPDGMEIEVTRVQTEMISNNDLELLKITISKQTNDFKIFVNSSIRKMLEQKFPDGYVENEYVRRIRKAILSDLLEIK